jgi:hypothetical protein
MGGSSRVRADWSKYVHRLYVVQPSVQYLQNLINEQNKLVEKYSEQTFPQDLHVTLILDDIGPIAEVMKSEVLAWIAANGRHVEIRVLILVQHLMKQCPSEVRSQAEIIFVFSTGNRKAIAAIHEEYVGCCEIRIFRSIFGAITEDFGVLAIDNRRNALRVEDCCFFAKHDMQRKIRQLGCPALWEYAEKHHVEVDTNGNISITNKDVRSLIQEDAEDDVTGMTERLLRTVLDTRRIYNDRLGQVVVKRIVHFEK